MEPNSGSAPNGVSMYSSSCRGRTRSSANARAIPTTVHLHGDNKSVSCNGSRRQNGRHAQNGRNGYALDLNTPGSPSPSSSSSSSPSCRKRKDRNGQNRLHNTVKRGQTRSENGDKGKASSSAETRSEEQHPEADSAVIPGLTEDVALQCLARVPRCYYGQFFRVSKKFCSLLKSGELYQTRQRLGIVEQWMYMLLESGDSPWKAYNPKNGTWRWLSKTPADYGFLCCDKESMTVGTQLLVNGKDALWIYDLVIDKWSKGPQMKCPRCLYASASSGNIGYVAGGTEVVVPGAPQRTLRSAESFDSLTGKWETLPQMNCDRRLCSGAFMDGKFHVIGGLANGMQLDSAEIYDPESKTWSTIRHMLPETTQQQQAPPLVAVVDNQLYFLDASCNQLKVYDKDNNKWRTLGEVPLRADYNSGWGVAFKALEGELFVIGAHDKAPGAIWAWRPDPQGGPPQWRIVQTLHANFIYNCAVMAA